MKWFIKYYLLLNKYKELKNIIDLDFWGDEF